MTSPNFPEAANRDLSAHQTALQEHGFCVIPDVLPRAKAASTLDRLWAAAEESRRRGNATHLPHLDPNAANVRVFGLLDLDAAFRELIAHPTAVAMVRGLLGDDFLVSNFTANVARPGSGSMGLHSDLSLQCPDPWVGAWALNVIWYVGMRFRTRTEW